MTDNSNQTQAEALDTYLNAISQGKIASPPNLSSSQINLAIALTDLAQDIQPEASFARNLEAKLRSGKQQGKVKHSIPIAIALAVCLLAVVSIPGLRTRFTSWVLANVSKSASAQTLADLGITITSDTQEYDPSTETATAIGNATLIYPAAQITASADRIMYNNSSREIVFIGNVRVVQRKETLQGDRVTCSVETQQCSVTK